jgi:hypothetical protein
LGLAGLETPCGSGKQGETSEESSVFVVVDAGARQQLRLRRWANAGLLALLPAHRCVARNACSGLGRGYLPVLRAWIVDSCGNYSFQAWQQVYCVPD